MKELNSVADLKELRQRIQSQRGSERTCIVTSVGTCGLARGASGIAKAIAGEIKKNSLDDSVDFRTTGCHGFCEIEPVVVIYPEKVVYQHVTAADVPEIIAESVIKKKVIDRLLYKDPATGRKAVHEQDIPFYYKQHRYMDALQTYEKVLRFKPGNADAQKGAESSKKQLDRQIKKKQEAGQQEPTASTVESE